MMSALCRKAVEMGAVSGPFTPEDMGQALGLNGAGPAHRSALWQELSQHVTEVLAPRYGWQVKPDARLGVLPQLLSTAQVRQLIADAPPTWAGDTFAPMLRDLLLGNPVAVETSSYSRNREGDVLTEMRRAGLLLDAVQFARKSPAADAQSLDRVSEAVKRHIIELRQRRDLLVVLPRKHFGYDSERRKLSAFLRSVDPDADPRPVFLSGIGGVGKSALHARLFRYWQQRSDGPLTITLDFDRRQLNTGSPVELLKEFLRQCSAGIFEKGFPPRIAKELGDGLRSLRYGLAEITTQGSFDRQLSEIATTYVTALQENWAAPLGYQPIAVAFDSFEALDRRGGTNVEIVLRLEDLLRQTLPRLRSLFAGREEPLDAGHMDERFGPPARRMRLQGIAPAAGAQLIAEEDKRLAGPTGDPLINAQDHTRIAEVLRGHPLAILMLVQFAHGRPDEIDSLLAELGEENGRFEAEFAQVFLYERILERIYDPKVRALAHPGLVLRQLNTDLIREVLSAPSFERPTDTPPTEEEAAKLKEALAQEYWLVEPDDQGFDLRHRPDLRRMMLPGLFAAPRDKDTADERDRKRALTASAIDVCDRAARYFREGPPEDQTAARARWHDLPSRTRAAHALYYASFVSPNSPEFISVEQARDLDAELGEDLETMPTAWRGLIKAQLDEEVSFEEQATLDEDLFEQVESSRFEAETKAGRSSFSYEPGDAGVADPKAAASLARMERQIAEAFANARFDRVAEVGSSYLSALEDDYGRAKERFVELAERDLTETPLWRVLLVTATQKFGDIRVETDPLRLVPPAFETLVEAIQLATDDEAPRHIAERLMSFIGDVDTPLSYRQFAFEVITEDSSSHLSRKGAFAALPLLAAPLADRLIPDEDHPPSGAFMETAIGLYANDTNKVSDVRKLYDAAGLARFEMTDGTFDDPLTPLDLNLLRGLTPELYEPLTTVLRKADPDMLHAVDMMMRTNASHWPMDLQLNPNLIDDIAPLAVETADRYGLLRAMAQLLAMRMPEAARVVGMHDTISDWFFPVIADRLKEQDSLPPEITELIG